MFEASPDALLAIAEDGRIRIANAAASRLFGVAADELVGSDHRVLLSEGFRNELEQIFRHLRDLEPIPPREVYGVHSDGTEFAAELAGALLESAEGPQLLVSIRSTSHRKAADADLREAMSLLTATLESTADGILVISSDGSVAGFNDQFLKMWGIPPELLEGDSEEPVMRLILSQVEDPEALSHGSLKWRKTPKRKATMCWTSRTAGPLNGTRGPGGWAKRSWAGSGASATSPRGGRPRSRRSGPCWTSPPRPNSSGPWLSRTT